MFLGWLITLYIPILSITLVPNPESEKPLSLGLDFTPYSDIIATSLLELTSDARARSRNALLRSETKRKEPTN
jgi:hypothetical protein